MTDFFSELERPADAGLFEDWQRSKRGKKDSPLSLYVHPRDGFVVRPHESAERETAYAVGGMIDRFFRDRSRTSPPIPEMFRGVVEEFADGIDRTVRRRINNMGASTVTL